MGSSISAWYDDCEDWESLKRQANITTLPGMCTAPKPGMPRLAGATILWKAWV